MDNSEEYKKWWLHYVKSQTPEGYFHLPLDARHINNLTPEEFDLFYENECELITDNPYGICYFICKKSQHNK